METAPSTDFLTEESQAINNEQDEVMSNGVAETCLSECRGKKKVNICESEGSVCSEERCVTLSGTIKRGRKAGQSCELRVNMSREELETVAGGGGQDDRKVACGLTAGPHVLLASLLTAPFAFILSSFVCFHLGTLTWYNVVCRVSEGGRGWVLLCPLLILLYPLIISVLTLGLGLYSALIQVSWFASVWLREVTDLEKGFYGWLCSALHIEECSPYEVVLLLDIKQSNEKNQPQDSILA